MPPKRKPRTRKGSEEEAGSFADPRILTRQEIFERMLPVSQFREALLAREQRERRRIYDAQRRERLKQEQVARERARLDWDNELNFDREA